MQQAQEEVYNFIIPDSQQPGFSAVYRKKGVHQLVDTPDQNITTVKHIIQQCRDKYGDKAGLGKIIVTPEQDQKGEPIEKRTVEEYTYKDIYQQADQLGRSLVDRKLGFREAERGMNLVGIYSKNRMEWYVADWACALFGFTVSPLYSTLGKDNLSYCIDLCGITTLFVEANTAAELYHFKQKGSLKTLICFDEIDEELRKNLQSQGLEVLGYRQLIEEGKASKTSNQDIKVSPEDIYTFCFTSGTTGPPKGALVSHGNMMASTGGFITHKGMNMNVNDVYLSTLPLPHLMERAISLTMFYAGAYLVSGSGNLLKLKEDNAVIGATILVSVPRLYNRIADSLKTAINGLVNGEEAKRPFVEQAVFSKFREGFGGKIKCLLTGSAPIQPAVQEYLQKAMGCPFMEGYGQTETPVALLISRETTTNFGMMQEIGSGAELRLQDIPEMKYTASDKDANGRSTPRGEICARGPQIFKGYYKQPELLAETIIDGWLHTGDVGEITPGLAFKVIDRKKNIFKLQQGEYVAPDMVEAAYLKSGLIEEIFLHGESKHSFVIAFIVPNKDKLMALAGKLGLKGSIEEVVNKVELRSAYLSELNAYVKGTENLPGFMLAKNVHLDLSGFGVKGMLTNTMKLIRFAGRKVFKQRIDELYLEGELKL